MDDVAQGVTESCARRSADSNTQQIGGDDLLGAAIRAYLHISPGGGQQGKKLSKRLGSAALERSHPQADTLSPPW